MELTDGQGLLDSKEVNMDEKTLILIDDGETFFGTIKQFKDCFFYNADEETIKIWARQHGYKVEFKKMV